MQLALVVAALDRFLERHVGAFRAGVLGGEERHVRRQVDRRVEQDEPANQLRPPGGELESEPASERMPDPVGRLRSDSLDDRVEVRVERPGRLVRRRPVPEEIRRKHVPLVREPVLGEQASMPAVAGDAVEEDDARSPLVAPAVEVEPVAHAAGDRPRLRRAGRPAPDHAPASGGASPPDCTLPRIT